MEAVIASPDEIAADWPEISGKLWLAIRHDPHFVMSSLYDQLMLGTSLLFEVSGEANGYWVVSLESGGESLAAWTTAIVGSLEGGPKKRVETLRAATRALERSLKQSNVHVHKICGRSVWRHILPDYTPFDGARNGLERLL